MASTLPTASHSLPLRSRSRRFQRVHSSFSSLPTSAYIYIHISIAMDSELACAAFKAAWVANPQLHESLAHVTQDPQQAPSPTAPGMQSVARHFEFRDGARFKLRYSYEPKATPDAKDDHGASFLSVEDDGGLHFGFLDDITARLLDLDVASSPPEDVVAKVLKMAVKMHTRAAAKASEAADNANGAGAAAAGNRVVRKRSVPPAETKMDFGPSRLASQTLMQQLRILEKQDNRGEGFTAAPQEDDLYAWDVKLFFDDATTPLGGDLRNLPNVEHLLLEFKFSANYPNEPPVARFVSPRMRCGHIMRRGGICMELLTGAGWSPVNSVDAVCIQIRALLLSGNARIDMERPHATDDYTLEGAIKDLTHIISSHNWTADNGRVAKVRRP